MSTVRASHILIKHNGSRRPVSFRENSATRISNTTRDQAYQQLAQYRADIIAGKYKFEDVAYQVSDCGSAMKGGDLGEFGRGQMQLPFETTTYGLKVGEISEIIDTDSGVHIILRTM